MTGPTDVRAKLTEYDDEPFEKSSINIFATLQTAKARLLETTGDEALRWL